MKKKKKSKIWREMWILKVCNRESCQFVRMLTKSKDPVSNHLSMLIPLPLMHLVLAFHATCLHRKLGNDWTLIISKPLGGHSTYTKVKFWTVSSVECGTA
ncbi:hypothetical protein CR513_40190, partial [Mucuna pruriens]